MTYAPMLRYALTTLLILAGVTLAIAVHRASGRPPAMPAASAAIATAPDKRIRHNRPPKGEMLAVEIRQLGNFEYDASRGGRVPADVLALDGIHIRTRGYMLPIDQAGRLSEFSLVPSLWECCFGRPPGVHHTLLVRTPPGKALSYFPDPIVVEGTLRVREMRDEDVVVSLFEVDCTSVKPDVK